MNKDSRSNAGIPGTLWTRGFATMIMFSILLTGSAFAQAMKMENEKIYSYFLLDRLESVPNLESRPVQWDVIGSIGKQYNRLWFKSYGNLATSLQAGEMEFQALYSRLISPYWEAQAGVQFEVGYAGSETNTRAQLVIGLEGLAPYWFELEPALFISERGNISASLAGTYDLFVTQRLILQPRLDVLAALQEVRQWGVGSGLNSVDLGLRLRYEVRRQFAPYVGFGWIRLFSNTADLARVEGADTSTVSLFVGVRLWS